MKKILFFAMLITVMVSCKNSDYTLTMNFKPFQDNGIEVDSVILLDGNGQTLQEQAIADSMLQMRGSIDAECIATLNIVFHMGEAEPTIEGLKFILQPGDIVFDQEKGMFTGTALNDSIAAFFADLMEAYQSEEEGEVSLGDMLCQYVERHSDDLTAPFMLTEYASLIEDANKLNDAIGLCAEGYQQLPQLQELKQKVEKQLESAEGQMFVDFECEYNGEVQHLSDYVGKGKYVLVDFWASWCGPCRAEIPNIIEVYQKYAGENFEVLGVATWDEPENTLEAIEEDSIPYPQMINAQQAGSNAYSINGIPQIILFGPDGTILKRNLRGENIEKAVAEALGETLE